MVLAAAVVPPCVSAQTRVVAVTALPNGAAQLTLANGRKIAIPKEPGQVGIGEAQVASNGSAGWLAEFRVESVDYPIAGALIIWRAGEVTRRFQTAQVFYSWAFYARGTQVAYHAGPLHGEPRSHCELHDVASGRTIAVWDGDLQSRHDRPVWTEGLRR
jgi:hypothetical protein